MMVAWWGEGVKGYLAFRCKGLGVAYPKDIGIEAIAGYRVCRRRCKQRWLGLVKVS